LNALPPPLGTGALLAFRLDRDRHAATWDSGEGAFQVGGRWNPVGTRAVYCALDPATAILEVAVHKGFGVLDRQPHTLTRFRVADPSAITVVPPDAIPDPDWLRPDRSSPDRRAWGGDLLGRAKIVLLPSAVSRQSWNLVFLAPLPAGTVQDVAQDRLVLDPRLNPGAT